MSRASSRGGKVYVIGVGMTRFEKPMSRATTYSDMAKTAVQLALDDAGLEYSDIQSAVVGYCYGDPTCGQRSVYEMGFSGIPVVNVNNNCSTGSTALYMARKWVQAGDDCVLALGQEQMERNLSQVHQDRGWQAPTSRHWEAMYDLGEVPSNSSLDVDRELSNPKYNEFTDNVIKLYAYAAREHKAKYGTTDKHFAKVAHKNHKNSVQNPFAAIQKEFSMEAVEAMPLLEPITLLQACPTGDGAAAAIVCSESFVRKNNLWHLAVEIAAQSLVTDLPSSFVMPEDSPDVAVKGGFISLSGFDMAAKAADECYRTAGVTPTDVDVLEVHDCFSANELMMYEALQLCPVGKGGALIDSAEWEDTKQGGTICKLGGRWVVNGSGGLESKGHPIGATGLGQCCELVWQLRGVAGKRQVPEARVALQHNFGIGGAAVVTLYRRPGESVAAAAVRPPPAPVVPPRPPALPHKPMSKL